MEAVLKVVDYWLETDLLVRLKDANHLKLLLNMAKTLTEMPNFSELKGLFSKLLLSTFSLCVESADQFKCLLEQTFKITPDK